MCKSTILQFKKKEYKNKLKWKYSCVLLKKKKKAVGSGQAK